MKCTGRLKQIFVDYLRSKYLVTIEVDDDIRKEYDRLKEKDKLSIEIKEERKKRSLDANAYYWVILSKIAEVLKVSKPYVHNAMLRKYGQVALIGNKTVYAVIPDTEQAENQIMEAETYHLKPTSQVKEGKDGMMYRTYMMLRGSSDYNTAEMSKLIDGLVAEANALDIETLTPDQLTEIKQKWGVDIA